LQQANVDGGHIYSRPTSRLFALGQSQPEMMPGTQQTPAAVGTVVPDSTVPTSTNGEAPARVMLPPLSAPAKQAYAALTIPEFTVHKRFSMAGIENSFIHNHANYLLVWPQDHVAPPLEWEAVVYKWIELKTAWQTADLDSSVSGFHCIILTEKS
jgi:hypothetical protein